MFADFEKPDAVLPKVELEPMDVDTILMTHLHFDHAGNLDAFPNANIIIQRYEYELLEARAEDPLSSAARQDQLDSHAERR